MTGSHQQSTHDVPAAAARPPAHWWRRLHALRLPARWGVKLLFVSMVTLLVLYPKVWLIPAWVSRMRDMNTVLQPDHPELVELEQLVRSRLPDGATTRQLLNVVQAVVNERIPYEYDWNLWGVMDWLPTVDETLRAGREDCDGRAVVAASLLRRMGHRTWLVSDYTHTWVACDFGETMAPRKTAKSLVAGERGTQARLDFTLVTNLAHGAAFGTTVFPVVRVVILLAAVVGAAANPWVSRRRQLLGGLGIFAGYGCFLIAGRIAGGGDEFPPMLIWSGFVLAVAGWLMIVLRFRRASRPGGFGAARPV